MKMDLASLLGAVTGHNPTGPTNPAGPVGPDPANVAAAINPQPQPPAQGTSIQDILRLAVPALLAGIESRRSGFGGGLSAAGAMAKGYGAATDRQKLQQRQEQQQQQEQQRIDEEKRRNDEVAAERQATAKARLDAAATAEQQRFNKLLSDAVGEAAKDPNFFPMVSASGPEKFTIPVEGHNVPLTQAFDALGVVRGPDGKYHYGAPPPPERRVPYRIDNGASTTEQLVPENDPRLTQPHVVSRATPKELKEKPTPKVRVRYDNTQDDQVVTYTGADGSSIDLPRENVRAMLKQRYKKDIDDATVDKVMRSAAAMGELVGP